MSLPPGATLVSGQLPMKLPAGASLVSGPAQPEQQNEGFLGSIYNDAKGILAQAMGPGYSMYKGYTGQGVNKKGGIAAAIEQPLFEYAQDLAAPAQNLLNVKNRYQERKAGGYGPVYRGAAAVQDVLHPAPFLSTQAEEAAASRGDTGAVIGHATLPLVATTAPLGVSKVLGKAAPTMRSALESSAAKNYEDVLNPTRVDTKYQTQKIMPQLLEERPVAMTRQGLANKAAGQADVAGQQIEQTVSGMQGSMKTQPVIDRLENLRQQYQVNGVSLRPEVDGAINTLQDQLRAVSQPGEVPGGAEGPGEPTISNQDVVRARRILDQAVAEVGGYQGRPLSDTSLANIRKETANSFREELSNSNPNLAALNAKFHFWNTLSEVMDATNQRKIGQVNALPKVETAVAAAGGLARSGLTGAAGWGAAMNLLGKAVRSTGWRTVSAATKGAIADALSTGRVQDVQGLLNKAGLVGAGAGQQPDEKSDSTPGVPIASLLDYDPVQARQALANPVTQHLINALNPAVADAAIKKFGVADTRKYFRGRNV